MELKYTQHLIFCATCYCIAYWTFKWFWIYEIISAMKSFQDTTAGRERFQVYFWFCMSRL